jgi:hypothetical protein
MGKWQGLQGGGGGGESRFGVVGSGEGQRWMVVGGAVRFEACPARPSLCPANVCFQYLPNVFCHLQLMWISTSLIYEAVQCALMDQPCPVSPWFWKGQTGDPELFYVLEIRIFNIIFWQLFIHCAPRR